MDFSLSELLNGAAFRHEWLGGVLRFFAAEGQVLFLALLAVLFLARGKWRSTNGRHGVVAAGFSATLALGAAQLIETLWDRPRPYEAHPGEVHLLLPPSADPSFPSDHATAAYAIAVAICVRHRKAGVAAFVLATLVAIGRVGMGTHYLTDVLGGLLIGAAAALLLALPPIRRPLRRLADWLGAAYERVIRRPRRSVVTPPSEVR